MSDLSGRKIFFVKISPENFPEQKFYRNSFYKNSDALGGFRPRRVGIPRLRWRSITVHNLKEICCTGNAEAS